MSSGNTFAIPTKDYNIKTLSIFEIEKYVNEFILFASTRQDLTFLVSKIGCGLAGLTVEQIAPLFENCVELDNVHLPREFWEVLNNGNEN